jgi:hypothetical protein
MPWQANQAWAAPWLAKLHVWWSLQRAEDCSSVDEGVGGLTQAVRWVGGVGRRDGEGPQVAARWSSVPSGLERGAVRTRASMLAAGASGQKVATHMCYSGAHMPHV